MTVAPRTPPRRDGADDGADDEIDGADDGADDESQEEDSCKEEEDESSSIKNVRGRRKWEVLGTWDQNEILNSEVNAEILRIATAKMEESGLVEWPSAWRPPKTSLWTLGHAYNREARPARLKLDLTTVLSITVTNAQSRCVCLESLSSPQSLIC
jgi:hypothetical protein